MIQSKIYEVRGQKVMLDFDLAEMYGIETRVLKQAVRRNIKRFDGEDFMFELTKEELSRSQIVTLNKNRGGNFKYMPFAFGELGVAMLSSVLNSDTAIEINRGIMRAFVAPLAGRRKRATRRNLGNWYPRRERNVTGAETAAF